MKAKFCRSALLLVFASATGQAGDVYIAVATNFAEAANHIGGEFERETGDRVRLSAGSSGKLFAPIKSGALLT